MKVYRNGGRAVAFSLEAISYRTACRKCPRPRQLISALNQRNSIFFWKILRHLHRCLKIGSAFCLELLADCFGSPLVRFPPCASIQNVAQVIPLSTIDRTPGSHRFGPTNDLAPRSSLDERTEPGAFQCVRSRRRGLETATAERDGLIQTSPDRMFSIIWNISLPFDRKPPSRLHARSPKSAA